MLGAGGQVLKFSRIFLGFLSVEMPVASSPREAKFPPRRRLVMLILSPENHPSQERPSFAQNNRSLCTQNPSESHA